MGVAATLLAFSLSNHWPLWLKESTWYSFYTIIIAFLVTGPIRYLVYLLFVHTGFDFWVLPNFYKGFCQFSPVQIIWPIISLRLRDDICSPVSLIMRILSASIIVYFLRQFYEDESMIAGL